MQKKWPPFQYFPISRVSLNNSPGTLSGQYQLLWVQKKKIGRARHVSPTGNTVASYYTPLKWVYNRTHWSTYSCLLFKHPSTLAKTHNYAFEKSGLILTNDDFTPHLLKLYATVQHTTNNIDRGFSQNFLLGFVN
jgi:hypothetical protein